MLSPTLKSGGRVPRPTPIDARACNTISVWLISHKNHHHVTGGQQHSWLAELKYRILQTYLPGEGGGTAAWC